MVETPVFDFINIFCGLNSKDLAAENFVYRDRLSKLYLPKIYMVEHAKEGTRDALI
jgi:hypothetical protein